MNNPVAQYIGRISPTEVEWLRDRAQIDVRGFVEKMELEPGDIEGYEEVGFMDARLIGARVAGMGLVLPEPITALLAKGCPTAFFVTLDSGVHVDGAAFGDYTLGIVLDGDHVLYDGRYRRLCDLVQGDVYLLHNKRKHGAKPRIKGSGALLDFMAIDFDCDGIALTP